MCARVYDASVKLLAQRIRLPIYLFIAKVNDKRSRTRARIFISATRSRDLGFFPRAERARSKGQTNVPLAGAPTVPH